MRTSRRGSPRSVAIRAPCRPPRRWPSSRRSSRLGCRFSRRSRPTPSRRRRGSHRPMNAQHKRPLFAGALIALLALGLPPVAPRAQEAARLPDWKAQWIRTGSGSFDPSKPPGLRQGAPLTPQYQALLEETAAAQAHGGPGKDPMARCIPPGMPRMMINYGLGMEFVITPETTYLMFGEPMRQLRRIYTDGRDWPGALVPSFSGYSIGRWEGDDGRGHADALVVETRGLRGPRTFDS